ncbi:MAG: DUF2851 family protein [Flavobacteriales bacterium]|nr:DUF2851 family protein [Flavobacteriales bacterium]
MNEDFLHYIWKRLQFDLSDLTSASGERIEIINIGFHNQNAGPDFLDARIRIGDTLWAGNVEIHINSSDWYRHRHDLDAAYDNVILHVVFTHDKEVLTTSGNLISTLVLKDRIDYQSYRKFKAWIASGEFIPCDKFAPEVPQIIKTSAIESAAADRLYEKSSISRDHLIQSQGDMEGAFYKIFLRALGMKVNALPFEQLSKIVPLELVRKVRSNPIQLEALFLGQAGFLEKVKSSYSYVNTLKYEYGFLRNKFCLKSMPITSWKLSRLRPQNFPEVRLAQLALFYSRHSAIAQTIAEEKSLERIMELFSTKIESGFWLTHYTMKKESPRKSKSFGADFLNHLVINAVVPFIVSLADYNRQNYLKDTALGFLEDLSCEKNAIIYKFGQLGFSTASSLDSQGILQLKRKFCDQRRCLNCKVGTQIMNNRAEIN